MFHAGFGGDVDHRGAIVIHAVGDDGPAVVEAFFDQIEFVAAARAVLGVEEFAGYGVEGEALRVAVAVAPYSSIGFGVTDEGIISGDAAVVVEAMDFAVGARYILGVRALAAFADGEEEITLAIEGDAAAEVDAAGFNVVLRFALVNCLLVDEGAVFDFAANDARETDFGAVSVLLGIAEGEIEPAVFCVIRMSNDVEQTGLAAGVDGRHAAQGAIGEFAVFDEIEVASFFGDHGLGGREEGERPGFFESADPGVELVGVELTLRRHGIGGFDELSFFAGGLGAEFADVDDHRADFFIGNRGAPRGHTFVGKAGTDAFSEALVVAAVGPDVVEHRGGHSALEIFAVAVGAKELEALGDGACADGLGGEARGRQRGGDGGEGEERAKEVGAGEKHAPPKKASAGPGARFRMRGQQKILAPV